MSDPLRDAVKDRVRQELDSVHPLSNDHKRLERWLQRQQEIEQVMEKEKTRENS